MIPRASGPYPQVRSYSNPSRPPGPRVRTETEVGGGRPSTRLSRPVRAPGNAWPEQKVERERGRAGEPSRFAAEPRFAQPKLHQEQRIQMNLACLPWDKKTHDLRALGT